MKSRRTIDYVNLVAETTKLLATRFQPDPTKVKQRIEHLMERGYMERDTTDKRILKYIA
jgi:predicted HTH transcriptional regulator